MADNSIASVRVVFTGDFSRLQKDFALAQAAAATAGQRVAASFGGAVAGSTGIVDQYGRAVGQASAQTVAAGVTADQYRQILSEENSILALSIQRNNAYAQSLREVQSSATGAHGSLTQLQAVSGLLRVSEGSGGIRAAEKFLTLLPGLGAAAQLVFPVVGAIALAEGFKRAADAATGLKEAEKELKEATSATDKEFANLVATIDKVNVAATRRNFGGAAGDRAEAQLLGAQIRDNELEIEKLRKGIITIRNESASVANHPQLLVPVVGSQFAEATVDRIRKQGELISGLEAQNYIKRKEQQDTIDKGLDEGAQEAGRREVALVNGRLQLTKDAADRQKQQFEQSLTAYRNSEQGRIDAIQNSQARAIQLAEVDVTIATARAARLKTIETKELADKQSLLRQQATAEEQGKSAPEKQLIQLNAANAIAEAQRENAKQEITLNGQVAEAIAKLSNARVVAAREWDKEMEALAREAGENIDKVVQQTIDARDRIDAIRNKSGTKIAEVNAAGAGQQKELEIQQQKLEYERDYQNLSFHTLQQELEYRRNLIAFDQQAHQEKIDGLRAEQAIAQADVSKFGANVNQQLLAGRNEEAKRDAEAEAAAKLKVAELQQKIADLTQQATNSAIKGVTEVEALQRRNSAKGAVDRAGSQLGPDLSRAIAKGVFDGGKGIGKNIADALKGVGRQLFGDLLTIALRDLALKLGITAAWESLLATVFGTAAPTLSATLAANTVASGVLTASNALNATLMGAMTSAMIAMTIALYYEGTTNLLGFASGGRPPTGVASIVGERGPELFIPDQAGTIVPNGSYGSEPGSVVSNTAGGTNIGAMNFNVSGQQNPDRFVRDVARKLPTYLKTQMPNASPYATRARVR